MSKLKFIELFGQFMTEEEITKIEQEYEDAFYTPRYSM